MILKSPVSVGKSFADDLESIMIPKSPAPVGKSFADDLESSMMWTYWGSKS
jgi:hypothetical protein